MIQKKYEAEIHSLNNIETQMLTLFQIIPVSVNDMKAMPDNSSYTIE